MYELLEKIITPVLEEYMSHDFPAGTKSTIKERIATVRDMQLIIYPNDHNPPHFHVKSKNGDIDAKFTIEDCTLLGGTISNKDQKRIMEFFEDPKTKVIFQKVWNNYQNNRG